MRTIIKWRWVAVVLVITVIALGVYESEAQVLGMAAQWAGTAVFDATNSMTTVVKAALASCLANCQKVWTVATLAASAAAEIAATVLFYGAAIGTAGVIAYMAYKGWQWANGAMSVPGATTYTIAAQGGSMTMAGLGGNACIPANVVQVLPCGATAPAGSQGSTWNAPSSYNTGSGFNSSTWSNTYWEMDYYGWSGPVACNQGSFRQVAVRPKTGYCSNVTTNVNMEPGTIAGMKTAIQTDLEGSDATAKQKARDAVFAAAGVAAPGYNSWRDAGIAPPPLPAAAWQAIADKLAAAIPSAKTQQLTDTANPAYATNPATSAMTKTDYRDAVRDGVEQALLDNPQSVVVNVPPIDWGTFSGSPIAAPAVPSDPEKKNLTTVMTTFKNAVAALPLISWASGLHVEIAGATSTLSLPVHLAGFNSNISVNFHDYESVLDFMGNSLLAMVSFAWVLWFFRGRNDG